MIIHHISDTHGYHDLLEIPECDLIIHSGDFSNNRSSSINHNETVAFLNWYENVPVKHKILVAGNHDAFAFFHNSEFREECKKRKIIYLENEWFEINGITIYGSPMTPSFGNWYYQLSRHKMSAFWDKSIPDVKIDIFVTHGPPKGVVDLFVNQDGEVEFCGDKALRNLLENKIKPKYVLFGHIHSNNDINNNGMLIRNNVTYCNSAVVKDNKFGNIYYQGTTFKF
jgi:Icc-related predicted phosphoesterase